MTTLYDLEQLNREREAATLARDYEVDSDRQRTEPGIKRERTGEHSSEWEAIQVAYGFGERS